MTPETKTILIYAGIAIAGLVVIDSIVNQTEQAVGTTSIAIGSAAAGVGIGYFLLPLLLV
jgi:hypothetical protein